MAAISLSIFSTVVMNSSSFCWSISCRCVAFVIYFCKHSSQIMIFVILHVWILQTNAAPIWVPQLSSRYLPLDHQAVWEEHWLLWACWVTWSILLDIGSLRVSAAQLTHWWVQFYILGKWWPQSKWKTEHWLLYPLCLLHSSCNLHEDALYAHEKGALIWTFGFQAIGALVRLWYYYYNRFVL